MAGKKANKPKKAVKKPNLAQLKPAEVLCPVCRSVFVEPVTLPCDHAFCKHCFQGTMENANLVCPLCRHRVGSWFRKSKKEDRLVDEEFWKAIQEQYPLEVANKRQGIDNDMEAEKPIIIVAKPGQIREEYEKEKQKDLEEQKRIREAEEKASVELIKKLTEEEEYKKQVEEEKMRLDALLAKKLAEELNMPSTSKAKTESAKKSGPMDRFITTEDRAKKKMDLNKANLLKLSRKSLLLNPSHSKAYSCHVLPVEQSPIRVNRTSSLFADLDFKRVFGTQGQKAAKIMEPDRRKSRCTSGYKSSGSGDNSDVIDQECRFYFKPIDTQRRHHVPGKVPLTVRPLLGINDGSVPIEAPSGKILRLGSVISAFANFKANNVEKRASSCNQIEAETPTSTNLKRKSRTESGSPARKKVKRQLFVAKKNLLKLESKSASSPFLGFDNKSGTIVNTPSFHGFDSAQIEESERNTNTLNWVVSHYGTAANKDYLRMSVPEQTFDSSYHQNSQKVIIPKRINRRKIDINRNIPKTKPQGIGLIANSRSAKILNTALGQSRVVSNGIAEASKVPENCPKVAEASATAVNGLAIPKNDVDDVKCNKTPIVNSNKVELSMETPPGIFDSDSEDEVLSKLINKICNQGISIENSPEKAPALPVVNGVVNANSPELNTKISPRKVKNSPKKTVIEEKRIEMKPLRSKKPTKAKSNQKKATKVKSSPRKPRNRDIDFEKKRVQEEADLAYARKLQAEFDMIREASTTRRGTKRQITLDDMVPVS